MAFHRRRRRRYSVNRKRRATHRRRNPPLMANAPRRRRRYVARSFRRRNPFRARRRYRRNPFNLGGGGTILGFPIKQIAYAGGAVIVAPYIERQILGLMPTSFAATSGGRWTAKVGAAVGVGFIAGKVVGGEAARLAYIVLGANLLADAVAEFMPGTTGTGYYPGMGAYVGLGASGAQPFLGNGGMGLVTPGMNARGPFVGTASVSPVRAMQDPFAPTF